MMTGQEFVSNGVAWHGSAVGWQSALSKALGVDSRTIRRAVKDGPSDKLAQALLNLFGDSAPVRMLPEWICGDGSDGREYIFHTAKPRFIAMVLTDAEYAGFDQQKDGDYENDGVWLCALHWLDRRPDDLAYWMERACDALDGFS